MPNGNYKLAKRMDYLVYTSGITPKIDGKLISTGKISNEFNGDQYTDIVEQAVKNAVHVAKKELNEEERLPGVLSMTVFVNAADDFTQHSVIADIASDYLYNLFGENGIGVRAAVGASSLPGDALVEIQIVFIIE